MTTTNTKTDAFGRKWTMGNGRRCEARSPVSGWQCREDASHDGKHYASASGGWVSWVDSCDDGLAGPDACTDCLVEARPRVPQYDGDQ